MPIRFRCPNGHPLTMEKQWVGHIVNCPTCDTEVTVPKPKRKRPPQRNGNREVEVDDDLRAFKAALRKNLDRLRTVNVGLALHFYKFVSLLVGITLFLGLLTLSPAAAGSRGMGGLLVLAMFLGTITGLVLPPILGIIGSGLCLAAPNDKARLLAGISLLFDVLGIGLAGIIVIQRLGGSAPSGLFVIGSGVCMLTAWVLFMLFVRQLANVLHGEQDAEESIILLIYGAVVAAGLIGIQFLIVLGVALSRPQTSAYGGAVFLLTYLLSIAWLVFYCRFIFRILGLISAIRKKIEGRVATG